MAIYRKVYYDKNTGQVIKSQAYTEEGFIETTLLQDYHSIKELSEYYLDVIGMLELRNDNLDESFRLCGNNIQVDLVTKELTFNYPSDNGGQPITSEKSLPEQLQDLKTENESLNLAIIELFDILLG